MIDWDDGRRRSSSFDFLLPQREEDVLVPTERILYSRRFHQAILIAPTLEFIGVAAFVVWTSLSVSLTRNAAFALLGLCGLAVLVRLALRTSRYKAVIFAIVVAGIWGTNRLGWEGLGNLVVLAFGLRLLMKWIRWRWYRKLIVTDRRVIQVDGIVGSSQATMPLFRVTDALLHTGVIGEILGFADFRIESAGQDQALGHIKFLDDYKSFNDLVIRLSTTGSEATDESDLDRRM